MLRPKARACFQASRSGGMKQPGRILIGYVFGDGQVSVKIVASSYDDKRLTGCIASAAERLLEPHKSLLPVRNGGMPLLFRGHLGCGSQDERYVDCPEGDAK